MTLGFLSRYKAFLLIVVVTACGGERSEFLSIGTGGTGGIYYPLGGALANFLSLADSNRRYTAEVTGGSVENVNRIATHDIDIGFAMGNTVALAYHGDSVSGQAPNPNLRILAPLYPNMVHVLVGERNQIASLRDAAGRRISVGSPGSGTEQAARELLQAYGLSYDDIDPQFLSFRESADALRDGAIDIAIIVVGYPASSVLEVTTSGVARLIQVDSDQRDILESETSYFSLGTIPAGAYPGVESDIPTVVVLNWLVGDVELDSEPVTMLLDILGSNKSSLMQVHEIAGQIDLANLNESPAPLHPAVRSWLSGRN
ncbi:MAG: TAXI family TRAP transporter solute-binding subunit [Gemmatimonadota bacterium]|nr:TAXI family TRAP transporter solute-binding subunit [Gemmatimonadota bacterium]